MADVARPRWIAIAANLLDAVADRCGDGECNAWDYTARWSDAEREEFGRAAAAWDGDDYDPSRPPSDSRVTAFLAGHLRRVVAEALATSGELGQVRAERDAAVAALARERVVNRGAAGGGAIDADAMVRAVPRLRYATASLASIVAELEGLVGA